MNEQSPETNQPEPKPEPLKFDSPVFDIIEREIGEDQDDLETRDIKPGESK